MHKVENSWQPSLLSPKQLPIPVIIHIYIHTHTYGGSNFRLEKTPTTQRKRIVQIKQHITWIKCEFLTFAFFGLVLCNPTFKFMFKYGKKKYIQVENFHFHCLGVLILAHKTCTHMIIYNKTSQTTQTSMSLEKQLGRIN